MDHADNHFQLNAKSKSRLSFGFVVAVLLHVVLIFGVVAQEIDRASAVSDLEITLVTHFSEDEPVDADFWAQENQQASGTVDEALMPTTTTTAKLQGQEDGSGSDLERKEVSAETSGEQVIATTADSLSSEQVDINSENVFEVSVSAEPMSLRDVKLARLDAMEQEYARRPKLGTLTSVSARARDDAAYQLHLQERITEIGNAHYPEASLSESTFGSLRLMLNILSDGTLDSVEILESSGHDVLDRAAIDIARLASPFTAFSGTTADQYDKIAFIRTWFFIPGGQVQIRE